MTDENNPCVACGCRSLTCQSQERARQAWAAVARGLDAALDSGLLSLEGFQQIRTKVQSELDPHSSLTEEDWASSDLITGEE